MESVYQATVPGWHSDPVFLADASFYTRPRLSAVEQMDAALAKSPSIIIAIDYLFWSVYGGRDAAMKPDDVERDRHDALEQALAQLDRFNGPIIVGDIPDMRAAVGKMLSERNIPPIAQLDAFNKRIAAWAQGRVPEAPAVVLPVAAMARAIAAGIPVHTAHETLPPEIASTILQPDRLHPTPLGLVILLREGLTGLATRGVIKPSDFRTDTADIATRLPAEAAAVDARREPGLWTLLSLKGKMSVFNDTIEKKDCVSAADRFDEIMEKVVRLKKTPHDLAGVYVSFTLSNYRHACPDASKSIRRWRDTLTPAIERRLPDPWPLVLWDEMNSALNDEPLTVERALRLRRENATLNNDYEDILRHAAREARTLQPGAYLELVPPWREHLDHQAKLAVEIDRYWKAEAAKPGWPARAEKDYQDALKWAFTDEAKQKIAAKRADYDDPQRTIALVREPIIDEIVYLERALRSTGQPEPAEAVRTELERLAPQSEIAAARLRVQKAIAERSDSTAQGRS